MYAIRFLKPATRDLKRLDKPITRRVLARLQWLANNLDSINPEPLKGELRGLFKLREGDYRIVYEPLKNENLIIVHLVGHRSEIYKRTS